MKLQRDLSKHSQLVSDMFHSPTSLGEWEKYKLSDEQVEFFNVHGYLSGIKLLDEEQIARLENELTEIMDPAHPNHDLLYEFHTNESTDPNKIIFHSLGHWRITPGFHDILWNPAFVMAAYQLLGNQSVRFWHDQLFCKPAKHGGVVAWHQDYSYWNRSVPIQHLTAWVGIDDSSKENGCLQYIPGSHKWGLLDKPDLTGEMEGLKNFLNEKQQEELKHPVPIEMKKGYGSFHHPLLVHGSFENSSDRPRRAFVINVFADGTRAGVDGEMLHGVPLLKKGEKFEGQFFPMLFNRNIIFGKE
ncbi:MAG: phytanoyl-CoA dioxygenase family protein [Prolixibacteraceae bacterium]|jgi:ectoine hydroxylase-related dioxygenase (phytanoyl-CoA dioxygenase family)|nr:phytanoyl-CoA dioxygenase family protein [Prolixibacteraceae bacterium]